MNSLNYSLELINSSNIPKAFGLNDNSFLIVIFGSLIIGYICLTFYYRIYGDNKRWAKLEYPEKAIVCLVIGLLSILSSLYIVTIYQLSLPDAKNLEQLFLQLRYISPFFYFIFIVALTSRNNFKGLDFIKTYLWYSSSAIAVLNIMLIFLIFYLSEKWSYIIYTGLSIIFIIVFIKYFPKIFESISSYLDCRVHKFKIGIRKEMGKLLNKKSLGDTKPNPDSDYVLLED
jgi:hypothetical protein